jgi:hypothetical protein
MFAAWRSEADFFGYDLSAERDARPDQKGSDGGARGCSNGRENSYRNLAELAYAALSEMRSYVRTHCERMRTADWFIHSGE